MIFFLRIAFRYLFSKKKRNVVNIINIISIIAVSAGTASLIIVLSAFNGLDGLVRTLFKTFDSELKITAVHGKTFEITDTLMQSIHSIEGIEYISEVIEDNALLKYKDKQEVIKIKGVSDNYFEQNDLSSAIQHGELKLKDASKNYMLLGLGVQWKLSIPYSNDFDPLVVWYPKQDGKISLNPEKAFNRLPILMSGTFSIERQYDDAYCFVPLDFASELTGFTNKRTALELSTKKGFDTEDVKAALIHVLGDAFLVQNSDEQHASLYRAHQIEKLFTFIIISFILLIVSLNIFFSLSMMVIEKQKDIAIMKSFGVSQKMIKKIFLSNGFILAFMGSGIGLFLGYGLCKLQQTTGIVPMGMESGLVDAYPIIMKAPDFLITITVMVVITYLVSILPAIKASKIVINEQI